MSNRSNRELPPKESRGWVYTRSLLWLAAFMGPLLLLNGFLNGFQLSKVEAGKRILQGNATTYLVVCINMTLSGFSYVFYFRKRIRDNPDLKATCFCIVVLMMAINGVVWLLSRTEQAEVELEGKTSTASATQMTRKEVLSIAEVKAKSEGYDIAKYNMTGCHYEFTRKNQTWTIFYELKPPTPPGRHFIVSVDDQTKKATLARGE